MGNPFRTNRWRQGGGLLLASLMTLALAAPASAVEQYTVTVCAHDSTGAQVNLGAAQVTMKIGSTTYWVADSASNGCRSKVVNSGTDVELWIVRNNYSSGHQSATINGDQTVDFYSTLVTLQYSGSIAFGGTSGGGGTQRSSPSRRWSSSAAARFASGSTERVVHRGGSGSPGRWRTVPARASRAASSRCD